MGALIIGQAITVQNTHAMDIFSGDNTEDNTAEIYNFYADAFSPITNPLIAFYHNTVLAKYNELSNKLTDIRNQVSDKVNEYKPICAHIETEIEQTVNATCDAMADACTELYNTVSAENQFRTIPGLRLIPGIGLVDALNDGAKTIYNYNYAAAYNNASIWYADNAPHLRDNLRQGKNIEFWAKAVPIIKNGALSCYQQTEPVRPLIAKGILAYGLYNYILPNYVSYPIIAAGTTLTAIKVAPMLPYAPQANDKLKNIGIDTQKIQDFADNAIEGIKLVNNSLTIENAKNLPITLERAVDNKLAEKFNVDPNGPVNADVIVDAVAKKAVLSITKYAALVTAGLFTVYKAGMYCVNKYQEYQKACALEESIKQHLTDEKKAEITQLTGKELSDTDVQEIINTIKTHATTTEDNHVTPEMVNLAVKEYVAKHISA